MAEPIISIVGNSNIEVNVGDKHLFVRGNREDTILAVFHQNQGVLYKPRNNTFYLWVIFKDCIDFTFFEVSNETELELKTTISFSYMPSKVGTFRKCEVCPALPHHNHCNF